MTDPRLVRRILLLMEFSVFATGLILGTTLGDAAWWFMSGGGFGFLMADLQIDISKPR